MLKELLYERMETYFRPIGSGDWRLNLDRLTDVVEGIIADKLELLDLHVRATSPTMDQLLAELDAEITDYRTGKA